MKLSLDRLFAPLDVASLVLFRICFGVIMMWEVWRYIDRNWVGSQFIAPDFHFKYFGFEWVDPWPGQWMYVHFMVLGVAALFVALGFLYRLSAAVMFLAFTYVFLLDQARYLNHFYLVSLMSFLMIFIPAHRALSIDALLFPRRRSGDAPAWALWLLRAQIGLVYFYAAVAKMNADWLQGEPMRMWLAERDHYRIIGPFLPVGRLFTTEAAVWLFTFGGLGLDLLITPALLWRRTRPYAFAAGVMFHLTNCWLFDIGIFPWFMLGATLLFFDPDWPRRIFNWPRASGSPAARLGPRIESGRKLLAAGLVVYLLVQVLMPLRHFLYPGTVHWTEEGHRFAWHMKLRNKSGRARITITDPANDRTKEINLDDYLTSRQIRKMSTRPDMALQFCHYLAEVYEEKGYPNVQVRAELRVSLNGRRRQLMVDPEVDLAAEPRTLWPASWIVPLTEPLRGPGDGD